MFFIWGFAFFWGGGVIWSIFCHFSVPRENSLNSHQTSYITAGIISCASSTVGTRLGALGMIHRYLKSGLCVPLALCEAKDIKARTSRAIREGKDPESSDWEASASSFGDDHYE